MIDYAYLIDKTLFACLIGVLTGVWAFLFTGPLSESGMVFGWLKALVYNNGKTPEWLYTPLVVCAKCNAFWWAVLVWGLTSETSAVSLFLPLPYWGLFTIRVPEINAPLLISAVFVAYYLEKQQAK